VEFRVLGPLEVLGDDGSQLALGGPKQRALLAVLVIAAGRVVSTDRLMDDLWGDDLPDTALNTIQVYVSQLRKILGAGRARDEQPLRTQKPGYVLDIDEEQTDLGRFRRLCEEGRSAMTAGDPATAAITLRAALGTWRGPALADFMYEPFAQTEIERFEELRLTALEDRVEADLDTGRHAELVAELEPVLAAAPHRERVRGHLMLALYRSGRQSEALACYQEGAGMLGEQLGLDPGQRLQRLHEAMLRQEDWLEPPQRAVAVAIANDAEILDQPASKPAEGDMLAVTAIVARIGPLESADGLSPDEAAAIMDEAARRVRRVFVDAGAVIADPSHEAVVAAHVGLPMPREDDVVRAIRAVLHAVAATGGYASEVAAAWDVEGPALRVGVVVGRAAVGADGELDVEGERSPMARASALSATAPEDSTVVDEGVVRRAGAGFAFEPRDDGTWGLLGRSDVGADVPSSPLVGRDPELVMIDTTASDLITGRGRVIVIEGDAGLGKTRMLAELRAACGTEATWLGARCLSFDDDAPSWPFAEMLRRWVGAGDADPEATVGTKLRVRLEPVLGDDAPRDLPFLARMAGARSEAGDPSTAMDPVTMAEATRRAYVGWVERLADTGPVVIALDDVHVADPATRALAIDLLALTDRAAVAVALAARSEAQTRARGLMTHAVETYRHRITEVRLAPLSGEDSARLADALSPTGALDPATRAELIERAEGNPLYMEEVLRALEESGGLSRTSGWTLSATTAGMMLPPALEGLLLARIQRLPEGARRLAQTAAAIGRDFPVTVLEAVVGEPVGDELAVLLRAEVVREVRRFPQLECTFHHNLMQEAALATMTPQRARETYGRVGDVLEATAANPEERLEQLAFCFYRSDRPGKAVPYLERAAEDAETTDRGYAVRLWERAQRAAERAGDAEAAAKAADRATQLKD
jgi:DNA-binding SARP family transcriptional activator/uncharacterized protein (DUF2384 family)